MNRHSLLLTIFVGAMVVIIVIAGVKALTTPKDDYVEPEGTIVEVDGTQYKIFDVSTERAGTEINWNGNTYFANPYHNFISVTLTVRDMTPGIGSSVIIDFSLLKIESSNGLTGNPFGRSDELKIRVHNPATATIYFSVPSSWWGFSVMFNGVTIYSP